MARRGPQYDLLQLLLRSGDQRLDEASKERLEQLYQEVAPQVRHRPRASCQIPRFALPRRFKRDVARLTLPPPPKILDGPAIENQLSLLNFLPTGCDGVDELLGGGLRQGQVTELTGEAGAGKTQLCLSAAASAAALGHRVVYVDTGGGFSATRVKEFHRGFVTDDADSAEVEQHLNLTLDLITVVKAHDARRLFKVLEELGCGVTGDAGRPGDGLLEGDRELLEYGAQLGLLVVDSLSQLLSPVLTRMHHQGYTAMASVGAALRALAPAHNCAVLYTNHTVSAGAGERERVRAGAVKPALGIRWTSTPHRRLCLTRTSMGAGGRCGAEVIYGPGTGSAVAFQVVGDGIRTL